jgi:hypothetical protein
MKKLLISLLLFCSIASADTHFSKYNFYLQELPSVCGSYDSVNKFAEDNNFVPFSYSIGREESQPDGQPIFIVTYWINEDESQTMVTIQIPDGIESCILYISFDLIYNQPEFKKGTPSKL